jgi:selenide,water dikinase
LSSPDDAAVYRITDTIALVQTVDFFTPIVDDPRAWGRIAAANALSDVYAMGGRPMTALNLVAWPRSLPFEILGEVLEGGNEVAQSAGVAIVGGHSVDDPEPKYGLAVTGTVHPDRVVLTAGAGPGDALILTKPLGTGIVSSGIKEGKARLDAIEAAVSSMSALNRDAADAMLEVGVHAATDVTGFGLVGHLLEMLSGDLDAILDVEVIPLLPQAVELAAAGVSPGGTKRNYASSKDRFVDPGSDRALREVLFDAQTSGGLLIAVGAENATSLLDRLRERGVADAALIGSIEGGDGRVRIKA